MEASNGASAVICYGRGGEISTNRREEVEITALCLRIRQAALVAEAAAVPGRAWRLRVKGIIHQVADEETRTPSYATGTGGRPGRLAARGIAM